MYKITKQEIADIIHKYDLNNGFSGLYYPSQHYINTAELIVNFLKEKNIPIEEEE